MQNNALLFVFWKFLQSWHKFYTTASRDKSQLCAHEMENEYLPKVAIFRHCHCHLSRHWHRALSSWQLECILTRGDGGYGCTMPPEFWFPHFSIYSNLDLCIVPTFSTDFRFLHDVNLRAMGNVTRPIIALVDLILDWEKGVKRGQRGRLGGKGDVLCVQ